jgi:hypothetical protein
MKLVEVLRSVLFITTLLAGCAHHRVPAEVTTGSYTMEIIQRFPVQIERDGTQVKMTMPSGRKQEYKGTIEGNDIELSNNPFNKQDVIVYKGTINIEGAISGEIQIQSPDAPEAQWKIIKK